MKFRQNAGDGPPTRKRRQGGHKKHTNRCVLQFFKMTSHVYLITSHLVCALQKAVQHLKMSHKAVRHLLQNNAYQWLASHRSCLSFVVAPSHPCLNVIMYLFVVYRISGPILPGPCESIQRAAENTHYGTPDTAPDIVRPSSLSQALHRYDMPKSACSASAASAFDILPHADECIESVTNHGGDVGVTNRDCASHTESDTSSRHVQELSSLRRVSVTGLRPNIASEANAPYPIALDRCNTPTSSSPSNVTSACSAPAPGVNVLPHAEFQRQVIRQLHVIRLMLQQQADINQHTCGNPRTSLLSKPQENIIKKPFDNLEEFKAFEASLTPEKEEKLTQELQYLGGKDIKSTTRRILCYVMTKRVAKNYSWVGHKGKDKFCLLKMCSAIMNAVRGNRRLRDVNAFEVESVIQSYLRHAN
ncbi:uncharacterized protein LOC135394461 [Ornithodoros turicata]